MHGWFDLAVLRRAFGLAGIKVCKLVSAGKFCGRLVDVSVSRPESDRLPNGDVVASALGRTLALLADTLLVGWTRGSEAYL